MTIILLTDAERELSLWLAQITPPPQQQKD
jgi:hypothetical protein